MSSLTWGATRWLRNLYGATEPFIMRGKFLAGASQAIVAGQILELSATNWIPLDADQAMAGVIAVAIQDIDSGDRAGYYSLCVPRPGDVFEYPLASAAAVAVGANLYWSSATVVTTTAGSNALGDSVGQENYPAEQDHLSKGGITDYGTTVNSIGFVQMTFKAAVSYWAVLQT
ncbi:MAG TPA: capsid cement protein, partial [Phycisphaerae bacterium]|nr:capsid cement protein [Phycisphaerae bacterium]